MTAPAIKERDITRTVRDYLAYRQWDPVRINAGPFGKAGQADYAFVRYKEGSVWAEFVWIEFKAPNGKLSHKQREWIAERRRKGATVLVTNNYDEFVMWYEMTFGTEGQLRLEV